MSSTPTGFSQLLVGLSTALDPQRIEHLSWQLTERNEEHPLGNVRYDIVDRSKYGIFNVVRGRSHLEIGNASLVVSDLLEVKWTGDVEGSRTHIDCASDHTVHNHPPIEVFDVGTDGLKSQTALTSVQSASGLTLMMADLDIAEQIAENPVY